MIHVLQHKNPPAKMFRRFFQNPWQSHYAVFHQLPTSTLHTILLPRKAFYRNSALSLSLPIARARARTAFPARGLKKAWRAKCSRARGKPAAARARSLLIQEIAQSSAIRETPLPLGARIKIRPFEKEREREEKKKKQVQIACAPLYVREAAAKIAGPAYPARFSFGRPRRAFGKIGPLLCIYVYTLTGAFYTAPGYT